MGKYMKMTKPRGKVAVMEVAQSTLGVRTRAKTLALQRLHSSAPLEPDHTSYLQLRNRRLEKPPLVHDSSKRPKQGLASKLGENPNHCSRSEPEKVNSNSDLSIEGSFGENVLEVEGTERGIRESTPCDLIRDPDIISTPGSTTRSSGLTGASRRVQNSVRRDMPLASELDEFFAAAEKEEQKSFIDKYNFDPATDRPLSGHFEWEKVDR